MKIRTLLLAAPLVLGFSACLDTPDLPDEPVVSNVSAILIDSLDLLDTNTFCRLSFDFTDGDGDIGLAPGDTMDPHNVGSIYYHNLLVDMYVLDSGMFVKEEMDFPFHGRIGNLTPAGQNKTLIGNIVYDMDMSGINHDTVQFRVRLIDRALHISNEDATGPIILLD